MKTLFHLHPILPFRLDFTVWALKRREQNTVDQWNGECYQRILLINNQLVLIKVTEKVLNNNKVVQLETRQLLDKKSYSSLLIIIDHMLGLTVNLKKFYAVAKNDAHLVSIVHQFKGLKPPRFPSIFEAIVNGISCQQISLAAGLQIQNRLIQYIGLHIPKYSLLAFPRPVDIANCSTASLKRFGYSYNKSESLIFIAQAILENETLFNELENKTNAEILSFLCQFKGIGPWTAEYVLLRGLGRLEIFPSDDIGARKNLQTFLHMKRKLTSETTKMITSTWYPFAGLIYFHLLLNKLHERKVV